MKRLKGLLCTCLVLLALPGWAANLTVIAPERTELTDHFTVALRQLRPADNILMHILGEPLSTTSADMVVTMGWRAAQWQQAHHPETPTVATYVRLEQLQHDPPELLRGSRHILLASPEPSRQVALARLLLPRIDTLGLLYSDASRIQLPAWQQAAESAGLTLLTELVEAEDNLARPLIDVLSRSDVLMAIDDQTIYRADTLRTLLLTSYARDKLMIGPSAPFIPAGGLGTTFSSPADMARSVSELLDERVPAGLSYPKHFSVVTNPHVARSLGFPPPDDAALLQQLINRETGQ
ncbi:hypothetical protein HG264_03645 [Pseudomonas sp. gcc21]|uniref:hypothetical protein n=1 Tax=Pseudomonas sp. gcc21 TaxID=2726989 RepID=UPI001452A63A|nr:hypothetical protein [Pseudomonas sp. gcc21]QJD58064.1 hypothetical protein HG264_03645 [Pseudomonas sp. gcc21]